MIDTSPHPLDIPDFLRIPAAERRSNWEGYSPPAVAQPGAVTAPRPWGTYPEHWLADPGTRAVIAEVEGVAEARKKERLERLAEFVAVRKAQATYSPKKVRGPSKTDMVAELLKRPGGCTTKDVLAATGWPSVSMPQQAKAAGLVLIKEKVDGVTRYRAG